MTNLKKYISESSREFKYRVKTVVDMNDVFIEGLETALKKYHIKDIGKPVKTIIQDKPFDFPEFRNTAVWSCEVVTELPFVPAIVLKHLKDLLDVFESVIIIRGFNEPLEVQTQDQIALNDINSEANKKNFEKGSLLSTDSEYGQEEDMSKNTTTSYGDEYNKRFLDFLSQVQTNREPHSIDPPNPLFKWLDMPKNDVKPEDFNSDIDSGVKPVLPSKKVSEPEIPNDDVSPYGNFYNLNKTVSKKFKPIGKGLDSAVVLKRNVKI